MSTIHHTPPKVSIIVPVYNQQRYIRKCLKSILQQSYKEIEIIVVNDGSTDNSLSIIRKMAKSDSRIIVIDKANGGVATARRDGLKKITGKYVMFVDSDDWLTPNAISSMVEIATREDVDVVTGKMIRHYPLWECKSGYMPALKPTGKSRSPNCLTNTMCPFSASISTPYRCVPSSTRHRSSQRQPSMSTSLTTR